MNKENCIDHNLTKLDVINSRVHKSVGFEPKQIEKLTSKPGSNITLGTFCLFVVLYYVILYYSAVLHCIILHVHIIIIQFVYCMSTILHKIMKNNCRY